MKTTELNLVCPYCGVETNLVTDVQGNATPDDSTAKDSTDEEKADFSFSICVECGKISMFERLAENIILRKLTDTEIQSFKDDEEFYGQLSELGGLTFRTDGRTDERYIRVKTNTRSKRIIEFERLRNRLRRGMVSLWDDD